MRAFRVLPELILLLLAYVLMATAGQAFAQERPGIRAQVIAPEGCSISDPVQTEDMYSFIVTQVQALSFARRGERASFHTSPTGEDSPLSQVPNFVGLRQERIDNTCAGFLLTPYTSSKIEGVATVAKYLVLAYQELAKMSDEMLGINLREGLSNTAGSARVQLADWSARRQAIIKNMTDAVNLSLSLLIRTDAEGKPDGMILSPEEKHSLLSYLNSQFPVRDPATIGYSDDFGKQAALIRSFISGGYNLGDSK